MAKGQIAKENIVTKIKAAFGKDFIGEFDKKIYLWGEENGEKVQIALTLTCPKVMVGTDFNSPTSDTPQISEPVNVEITQQEQDSLVNLLKKFNL